VQGFVISRNRRKRPERPLCKPSANERVGSQWHSAILGASVAIGCEQRWHRVVGGRPPDQYRAESRLAVTERLNAEQLASLVARAVVTFPTVELHQLAAKPVARAVLRSFRGRRLSCPAAPGLDGFR